MPDPRTGNLVRNFALEEGFEVGAVRVKVIGHTKRKARLLIQAPLDQKVRFLTEATNAGPGDRRQ
jgi:hypothetical protein